MSSAPSPIAARKRPLLRAAWIGFCCSVPFSAFQLFCSYRAYRHDGDVDWLWTPLLFFMPVLMILAAVSALSLVFLFFGSSREAGQAGFVWVAAAILGLMLLPSGGPFLRKGMATIATNAEPVLRAINAFHSTHGTWPPTLEALSPEFIPAIPNTGLGAYPKYEYFVGEDARVQHFGNPWVLLVRTPSGGINWDLFLYYPLQNYPREGHGGSLERMGKWAYVHE